METRLMLTKAEHDMLDHIFNYHAPNGKQVEQYRVLRSRARWFAETILAVCPEGPDRDAALLLLRQSLMTANAAIALRGQGFHELNQAKSSGSAAQEIRSSARQEDTDGGITESEA